MYFALNCTWLIFTSLILLSAFIAVAFEDEVVLDGVRGEVRVADGEGEGGRRRLSPGPAPLPPLVRGRVVVGLAAAAAPHHEGLGASNIYLRFSLSLLMISL